MKYVRPYFLFSLISCIVAILFSMVFRFSLTNTWQAGVAIVFIFGPFLVFGWKFSRGTRGRFSCPLVSNLFYKWLELENFKHADFDNNDEYMILNTVNRALWELCDR